MVVGAGVAIALATGAPSQPAHAKDLSPADQRSKVMSKVKNWGYQLQRLDVPALAVSPFDLLVIDHAPDRVDSVELLFRRADLEPLKKKPDGSRRQVLAYVSIGEAERYRFYWDDAWLAPDKRPTWLGAVNPKWVGNYPVEFWQTDWQSLIFGHSDSYIDRILEAGFDGIYLDRADVYDEFKTRPAAQAEMVNFVSKLVDHARKIKPDVLVVMQNAEELIRNKEVRARIDGVAKESLFFNPDLVATNTETEARASLDDLRFARKVGRRVLLVEYLGDPTLAKQVRSRAEAEGFLIHFAERTLSSLNLSGPDQQATAHTVPASVR